ncbi:MAG: DUF2723 domain-containing protein [Sphingobacteriales bacterium]|jgi:hypothetical protein|nr:DUF2723 domain-containing protein [Sphingobacteriales bacterium]
MSKYNQLNSVLGWLLFAISLATYTLTLEPTVSFWDCGEFISASYRLQICHPPGAPLFLMIGRIFSLLASDPSTVAFWVNMVSAVTSALTVMFMFWTITHLAKKIMTKANAALETWQTIAIMGAGAVGALTLTFSDTFWFSAVEAEVYASSSFFTTLTFWCILKWENVAHEKDASRWLVLIAYLIGLAIGVHLLNLLVIPAIVYVYYFKKYTYTRNGFIGASAIAILTIGIVQFGIIPGLPGIATKLDYFTVNSLGLNFNSGAILLIFLLITLIASFLHYTHSLSKTSLYVAIGSYGMLAASTFFVNASLSGVISWAIITGALYFFIFYRKAAMDVVNLIVLCFSFVVLGYSSYSMIIIRSLANPPIDMNDPEQPFSLLSYLNREQYGENPLVYGQYFYAKVIDYKKGAYQYAKGDDGQYVEAGQKIERIYDPKDCTIFPRMWADRADYVNAYREWEKIPEGKKANMAKNVDFLLSYQLGFMYWRYFFWNFIGRQNDEQGYGDLTRGNWISGIDFIDEWRLGPQKTMPEHMKNNKAKNTYYFLPLILGLLGVFFHFKKAKEDATIVMTLFLFTGFFIILYLNFPAHQPRERDYAYVGSYQTFMIWVGLGVLALVDWLAKKLNRNIAAAGATALTLVSVPVLMASENWDDHDRSNRYTALHFAENYLNSCEKDAILFTNGDNDTYPLWYAQNVENIRSDIRVVNMSLLNTDWYADGLKRPAYDSKPIEFSTRSDQYRQGKRDYVVFYDNPELSRRYGINKDDYYPLKNVIAFMNDDNDPMGSVQTQGGESLRYYPTKRFCIIPDKEACIKNGVVKTKDIPFMVDSIKWEIGNNNLMKADLILLDIIASNINTRPIYWAITTGSDVYMNLQAYFQLEGLTYRLVPIANNVQRDGTTGRINTDILYTNLMEKFKFGNMEQENVYLDETILRQTKNFRNIFYRLSESLLAENKKDSAIKVLDYCLKITPNNKVQYDVFVVRIVEGYYNAGEVEKANKLAKELMQIHSEKVKYFNSFKGKRAGVKPDIEDNLQIMGYIQQVVQMNRQEDLSKAFLQELTAAQNGQ